MPVPPRTHRYGVCRPCLVAVLTLALAAPVSTANAAVAQRARAPSAIASTDELCKHFEDYSWLDEKADKTVIKGVLKGLIEGISKTSWGRNHGLGSLKLPPATYGAGSTAILGFAKASCPTETLLPAAQSLQYLAPDLPQQRPVLGPQDYNAIYPPRTDADRSAQQAAQGFNSSGSTGMTGQQVLNLSDALCADIKRGEKRTNLSASLGRPDLNATDAANILVSLTRDRCRLSPPETDAVAGRLNDFLVVNQQLAELPPFLSNPTWVCGASPEQAKLSWTAGGVNPITLYELYRRNADGTWSPYPYPRDTRGTDTITVLNLGRGIHDFALRATDDHGNQSAWVWIRTNQQLC
ncbi:hypothetical protein [Streptomyces sp. NPDC053079]|uniref:hypothetical protein n=1 Tax=Streptomyces sp. NPDC053079 TaxID=3365697 RepID=UPI0037D5D5FB